MSQCVLMMGTFDSKGNEFAYLYKELLRRNVTVKTMNVGVFEPKGGFPIDIPAGQVAVRGGTELVELRRQADRGVAMRVMCNGARSIVKELQLQRKIDGIISMAAAVAPLLPLQLCRRFPSAFPRCASPHWHAGIPMSMWGQEISYCFRPLWISAESTNSPALFCHVRRGLCAA